MNEEQTSIFHSWRNATKIRGGLFKHGDVTDAIRLDVEYNEAYRRAFAGGDKFQFHRVTRRYLKALRALSQHKR